MKGLSICIFIIFVSSFSINTYAQESDHPDGGYGHIPSIYNFLLINNAKNIVPTANTESDRITLVNQTITISGSGNDPDGTIISYLWQEGETELSGTASFPYTPTTTGQHILTLTVTDDGGATASDTMQVTATESATSPNAPSNLGVYNVTETGARLSFLDNADDENGFRVYDSANNLLADNIPLKEGSGEYQYRNLTGLACNTIYTVKVAAYNENGESSKSDAKGFQTKLCENVMPTASASAVPMTIELGGSISFSCTGNDEDGTIEQYRWLKGVTEVAEGETFTTNEFSVGSNTYTCEVKDDRGGRGRDYVTVTISSDAPTAYATGTPGTILEGERAALQCTGNETYPGGIDEYTWYKDAIVVFTGQTYMTPADLAEGDYTYICEVKYSDNITATDDVDITVNALSANLEAVDISEDFEGYAVGSYDPSSSSSPVSYIGDDIDTSGIIFESFGIVDRGGSDGKAFCMKIKVSGTSWSKQFKLNIPGLDRNNRVNLSGNLKLDFDYKQTLTDKNAILWINLYDRFEYRNGRSTSTTAGGSLLFNTDPGTWQKSLIDDFNYRFGMDNPFIPGGYYGIQQDDTGKEITALALNVSNSSSADIEETLDFCIDNIRISGTQMKPGLFDEEYGAAGGYQRWADYKDRISGKLSWLVSERNNLPAIPSCIAGLSVKQDYQCHKLSALKDFIDDKIIKMQNDFGGAAQAFDTKDVQRAEEAIGRYKATHAMFMAPPAGNSFNAYRVPAMKYGRLDGYTFPMGYKETTEEPYNLRMAKGEYKSIAILLDPGQNYNRTLEFTNTPFSGGGIIIDKYIAKVWYQAGKDDSVFDKEEFEQYTGEGDAWLTQELLLKNDALVKIERDPDEKNMIYYSGSNLLYTERKDGGVEDFGNYGSVPGYLQISSAYNNRPEFHERYNLRSGDANLLKFDDENTIQPFVLDDSYKLLWGIIHVDKNAASGLHTASIEIKDGGVTAREIPVNVTVSGYELSESKLDYGVYYHGRYGSGEPAHSVWARPGHINKTRTQQNKELKDMLEHGVRYPLVEMPSTIAGGAISHARAVSLMDDLRDLGFPDDKFYSWDGNVFARSVTQPEHIHSLQLEMENHDHFSTAQLYLGVVDEASVGELADSKRFIRDVVRGDTWKNQLNVRTWGGAFKSAVELLADGGYLDAPVINGEKWSTKYQLNRFHTAEIDENGTLREAATVYKYGDPQTGVENPEVYRRNFGISMYQEGFSGGGMDYAYQKQYGFYWNDFDLAYTFEKNHREEAFTYPTSGLKSGGKGFVSTIQWEGYREAITDMRYVSTLLDMNGSTATDAFIENLDTENGDLDAIRESIIDRIGD